MIEQLRYWGYLHVNGKIQLKRACNTPKTLDLDLKGARESPFCAAVVYPFLAKDEEEAIGIMHEKLRHMLPDWGRKIKLNFGNGRV